jgi:hypothetical protein
MNISIIIIKEINNNIGIFSIIIILINDNNIDVDYNIKSN